MPQASKYDGQFKFIKWAFLAVLICIPVVVWLLWGDAIRVYLKNSDAEKVFGPRLEELFNEGNGIISSTEGYQQMPEPKSRGAGKSFWLNVKVIPRSNRLEREFKVDQAYGALPDELRAAVPEEVETLIIAYPSAGSRKDLAIVSTVEMSYRGAKTQLTGPQLQYWVEYLDVHVVDMKNKKYLGRKGFLWEPTAEMLNSGGSHIPERIDADVVNWYSALPAK